MTTMITHIKFNTKIAVILIVAGTIGLMAGPARAEITSWTDNGDGINWNDALNWDNGVPDATKDVVIGNTTVNRIISVTATTNIVQGAVPAAGYRTLTIDQTTAGVTNQLKLDVAMGGFLNNTYPSFTGGGAIILNLNGKQWRAHAGGGAGATTFTLPSNVTHLITTVTPSARSDVTLCPLADCPPVTRYSRRRSSALLLASRRRNGFHIGDLNPKW